MVVIAIAIISGMGRVHSLYLAGVCVFFNDTYSFVPVVDIAYGRGGMCMCVWECVFHRRRSSRTGLGGGGCELIYTWYA